MKRIDMAELSIIIVNYNVHDLLRECLLSVFANKGVDHEVCVVDNNSSDGSAAMVKREFRQVHLIESPVNGGYAYANNLGLKHFGFGKKTRPEGTQTSTDSRLLSGYVLLLNPDTVLPPLALKNILDFMDCHPEAGIVGPKLVRPDGSLDLACRRSFPSPQVSLYRMLGLNRLCPNSRRFARYNLTYLDPDELSEVDSVVGAFMIVRREAIEQVELLDETFFMYGEDLDWAFRIKEKGWKVYYNPAVTVLHHKGASSRQRSSMATIEFYRAMLIFYRKHYAQHTPFFMSWIIVSAIYLRGAMAHIQNLLRSPQHRRVGSG
jgi:N-acetylglucosaminyl-diphospho-decaprenol L-rhamnosyltransferase